MLTMLVSVYIRKADEEKWRKLPNKSDAISKMLNGQKLTGVVIKETIAVEAKDVDPEPFLKPETSKDHFAAKDEVWEGPIPRKGKKI